MRFGGHETFHIRNGWLFKGMALLADDPEGYAGKEAADLLGVGNNMAKAIRHWLLATGLAEKGTSGVGISEVGKLVQAHDPYFTASGTWWMMHVNLVNNRTHALSWHWFFNRFGSSRFEKAVCVSSLKRYLDFQDNLRTPAQRTLERDVGVLLNSYAKSLPARKDDPEDSKQCGLQQLNLLTHFAESGFHVVNFKKKSIPPNLLGYAFSVANPPDGNARRQVPIQQAATGLNQPGKVFCYRAETLFDEILASHEAPYLKKRLRVSGMAGSRVIDLCPFTPARWLEEYYKIEAKENAKWEQKYEEEPWLVY